MLFTYKLIITQRHIIFIYESNTFNYTVKTIYMKKNISCKRQVSKHGISNILVARLARLATLAS
jgi:hypothetical protein